MAKATPGKPYVVQKGDNLSRIANQAYGDASKWPLIWKANQAVLRSDDPNLIFPGETVQVPPNPLEAIVEQDLGQASDEYLPGKGENEFTLVIEGEEIPVETAQVVRTMDTAADGWTASTSWNPADERLAKVIKPYTYGAASVYLGPWLVVRGRLYIVAPSVDPEDGYSVRLEGFSPTVDIVDSNVRPPYEQKKVTLEQRALGLLEPFGINVIFDADSGDVFDRVTAQKEEKILDHLGKLAAQRSVLISSTTRGDLIFYQAKVTQSVGILTDDLPPHQSSEAEFDGRKRFNVYRAIGPTPKRRSRNALEAVAKDDAVPRSRFLTFSADDATAGNIQSAADWRRSKQMAEALSVPYPVSGWYAPDGSLWRENTIVTVQSAALFIPDGFDFLIKSVTYNFDSDGPSAILDLVPPSVYTGQPLEEPWR